MYEQGVVDLADIKSRVLRLLPFSSLFAVASLLVYLAYRLECLYLTGRVTDDPLAVANSLLYFVAELGFLGQYIPI